MKEPKTISEYIASEPAPIRPELKELYKLLKRGAPDSGEKFAWGMPTLTHEGNLVHFCAFKNHMSVFPGPEALKKFKKELGKLQTSKGTIQFVYGSVLPGELLSRIVRFNLEQNLAKARAKAEKKAGGKKKPAAKKKSSVAKRTTTSKKKSTRV